MLPRPRPTPGPEAARTVLPPQVSRRPVGGGAQGANFDFGGFDFTDMFEGARGRKASSSGSGSFKDIFSGIFGGRGGAAQEGPGPGSDLEYQVNVPFWTAIRGGVMRLNITRRDSCPHCHGQGFIESAGTCPECGGKGQVTQTGGRMKFNVPCPRCHGTGKNISTCPQCHGEGTMERTEPLEVRIKAGTRDGQRIRLAGKGNAGVRGGPAGDLYVIIRTADHPVFHREGDDIRITVPVSATEAALGAKIEVPTIDGRTLLKIPPGTQCGQKLRLREKGVPSATKESARGDEIVEIKLTVPMPKDERSKEILRELAKLNPEDPRGGTLEEHRGLKKLNHQGIETSISRRSYGSVTLPVVKPAEPEPAEHESRKVPVVSARLAARIERN